MPTRAEVQELIDAGHTYATAARELGIPAGQVFMIATGLPADGSDAPPEEELKAKNVPSTTQALIGPPPFNPTGKQHVLEWVQSRAARELNRPST